MEDRIVPVDDAKRCSKCRELKQLSEFNQLRNARDGRQSYCRDCNKEYHYTHWDRHMIQIRARRVRTVLEFDHLRDKTSNVSYLIGSGQLKRVKQEIAKCEVVCANCHRRRTARRGDWYRHRAGLVGRLGLEPRKPSA